MTDALLDLRGGALNIACVAGDEVAFDLPTPSDLSAWTWAGQIRLRPDTTEPLLGEFVFTLTTTTATCKIAAAVTRTLPTRSVYDIQVSQDPNSKHTLLSGVIEVSPDVTL